VKGLVKGVVLALVLVLHPRGAAADVPGSTPASRAPADEAGETLIGPDPFPRDSGWYVAPSFGVTAAAGHFGYSTGIRGAWVMNRTFGVGLSASSLGWNGETREGSGVGVGRTRGAYGGLLLQYNLAERGLVHGFVDATLGGGATCEDDPSGGDTSCHDTHAFLVVEPAANLEINVISFMRVAIGAGYRFAGPGSARAFGSDMSGLVARTSLEFGRF